MAKFQKNLALIKSFYKNQYDALEFQKIQQKKYIDFMTDLQTQLE